MCGRYKTMKPIPPISDAESAVMEALWKTSPSTADEVFAVVGPTHHWQETTVKTLLGRLLGKGAVRVEKEGRRYLYTATFTRDQWLHTESKGFLDRRFGGRIAPLVAHFCEHRKLTKKDLVDLKRLIRELDDDQ